MDVQGLRKDVLGQNRYGTVLRKAPFFPDSQVRFHALGRNDSATGNIPGTCLPEDCPALEAEDAENAGRKRRNADSQESSCRLPSEPTPRAEPCCGWEAGDFAGTGDSMDAFLGHIAPGSTVYHDMGHFAGCFPGCTEVAVNSKDGEAYELLNPVNRLCAQVKRLFAVHLRIHRKNVPLWLSEKAFQMEQGKGLSFGTYRSLFYREIFLSGKIPRRWEVYGN